MFDAIWIYHCGFIKTPEAAIFAQGAAWPLREMPIMGLAALHATRGLMLVDAPYGREGPGNAGGLFAGVLTRTLQRFKPQWSIIPRLEEMGFRASDVEAILMTHLHHDHTGGLKELAYVPLHVSEREWRHAMSFGVLKGLSRGYAPRDYRLLTSRVQTFQGEATYRREAEGHDLLGDGSVRAISLPGHTIGHTGYHFTMSDGREVFYLGDAVFDVRQITHHAGLGSVPRSVSQDLGATLETIQALQRHHAARPHVELLCAHDFSLGRACEAGPLRI